MNSFYRYISNTTKTRNAK